MSKTLEKLAEEYCASPHEKDAFLAGYQAAKEEDTCEHILDMSKMVDVNGWISVKDRLPEKNSELLLLMCVDGYELGYYERYTGYGWTNVLGTDCLNVTHWMPLPEAPKEEK